MTVGIVGLGLMGGSLSLAMRDKYDELHILGYDHNDKHTIEALELGLVDKIADTLEELSSVDVLFLSVPVDGIVSILGKLENILKKDITIIDLGSTKERIVASIPQSIRANFVAAHPMTGTEKFGPSAAIDDLYKGKVVVLCDTEDSGESQLSTAREIFANIGMKIFYMGAKEHDRHAAFISHMPHAISYALANSVMEQENTKAILALAGGGFRDMSRIAKSSPNMWEDVFRQNRDNLLEAIESFAKELNSCKQLVEDENWEELHKWMSSANSLHNII